MKIISFFIFIIVLSYSSISISLTDEELLKIPKGLLIKDINKNGTLEIEEIKSLPMICTKSLKNIIPLQDRHSKFDFNGDGLIEKNELIKFQDGDKNKAKIWVNQFQVIDCNNNGKLEAQEISYFFKTKKMKKSASKQSIFALIDNFPLIDCDNNKSLDGREIRYFWTDRACETINTRIIAMKDHPAYQSPEKQKSTIKKFESIEVNGVAKTIPIVDVHMHMFNLGSPETGSHPKNLVSLMNVNKVKWGGGVGHYSKKMHQLLGDRYIPMFGRKEWIIISNKYGNEGLIDLNNPDIKTLLKTAEDLFKQNKIKGFGEIHTDNAKSGGHPGLLVKIKLDTPVINKMYEISNKYNGVIQIHTETNNNFNNRTIPDIINLSLKYPNTKTILAHCLPGHTVKDLYKIFENTKNVFCELSGGNGDVMGKGKGKIYTKDGMKPNYLKLFKKFPDRVMLGTDPCCGLLPLYSTIIKSQRSMLSHLPKNLMENIANKNAIKVFNLKEPDNY